MPAGGGKYFKGAFDAAGEWARTGILKPLPSRQLQSLVAEGGFMPGQREQLLGYGQRELGARTNIERSLMGERLAGMPGGGETAFGDAQYQAILYGQQRALADYMANVDRMAIERQYGALGQLYGGEQAERQRKHEARLAKQQAGYGALGALGQAGGQLAGEFVRNSGSIFKKNIRPADSESLLEALKSIDLKNFQYKEGMPEADGQTHVGMLAEEAPYPIGNPGGMTVSMMDAIGVLIGAVQELAQRQENYEEFGRRKDELKRAYSYAR